MTRFRIRPVTESDLEAIARIHTYYAVNTTISLTTKPKAHTEYLEKFRNITSLGLPYLVAEDTASPSLGIVAFANAHPFQVGKEAYASTAELTIFCDPEFVGVGLGTRLLGAVVGVLKDRQANAELVLEKHRGTDPRIAQFLAVMTFDPDGSTRLKQFYEKNGFTMVGHLRKVACKLGKWIDTLYLQMPVNVEPTAEPTTLV